MATVRLLVFLFAVALGLGPGRPLRAPSPAGDVIVRLAPAPAGEPAHRAASARLAASGLAARPPTSGPPVEGRSALPASAPSAWYAEPLAPPASLVYRAAGWRSTLHRPPYFPTAPPARSRITSIA